MYPPCRTPGVAPSPALASGTAVYHNRDVWFNPSPAATKIFLGEIGGPDLVIGSRKTGKNKPMNEREKTNDRTAEKLTEAIRSSYKAAMESTAAVQESNARLARSFFEGSVETFETQLELNRRAVQR